ncbi:unnamed protein product [Nippostrongylus brasiliensis]|uniref:Reverse transcriptase domain-containing protein n=1 Tax=Nippostrongylus brasiliensis TaxID=27835 RepID=A0A0N4XYH9_NIPBR|nr:unnamed protein product [Nippostrongylus brasiliensis]
MGVKIDGRTHAGRLRSRVWEDRLAAAYGALKSVKEVVRKAKNARLRAHLFDSTVLRALTYASESWALHKQDEHGLRTEV